MCLLAGSAQAKFGLSQNKYHLAKATALGAAAVGNLYIMRTLLPETIRVIKDVDFGWNTVALHLYIDSMMIIVSTYLANKAYESYKEFSTANNDNNPEEYHETTN